MTRHYTNNDQLYEQVGNDLINLLHLKVKMNGRVNTSYGDKTPLGLAITVQRVVQPIILDALEEV